MERMKMDYPKKIAEILKGRFEIINERYKEQSISPDKKIYHLPDQLPRIYVPALKKKYGLSTMSNITRILSCLASHCNKDGCCYLSFPTILRESGISNRNGLKRMLTLMDEELNMIKVYPGRGRVPNVYKVFAFMYWKDIYSIDLKTIVSKDEN